MDKMKKCGVIKDERNEPMTDFNHVTQIMEPLYDLMPKDEDGESIQTGTEEAPYNGSTWNEIPRQAIA